MDPHSESEDLEYDCRLDGRRCVFDVPHDYDDIGLYILGDAAEVEKTECPGFAAHEGAIWYGDLFAPMTCPTCECGGSSCALPTDIHVSPLVCPGNGGSLYPFDAPAGWEGECTSQDAIPADLLCDGVPCVRSMTVPSPVVLPCEPATVGAVDQPLPVWGTMAKQCQDTIDYRGCGNGEVCAATVPPGGSLRLCLIRYREDDGEPCPYAEFPQKFVMYRSLKEDLRSCTSCECGEPQGTQCTAYVTSYVETSCSDPVGSVTVTTDVTSACVDLPPGSALGSKGAFLEVAQEGQCLPTGGEIAGQLNFGETVTLCCEMPQGEAE